MNNLIKQLQKQNLITIIDKEVDIYIEIGHIAYIKIKQENSKVLLFTNVVDKKNNKKFDTPVMINLFSSFKMIEHIMGDIKQLEEEISSLSKMHMPSGLFNKISMLSDLFSLKSIFPKRLKQKGICQEIIYKDDNINLYNLPILTTWEKDSAPFITMGQVYTQSLDGKRKNLGMYRLQVHNKNQLGLHFQIHKDSNTFLNEYKKAGIKMPVSIAIGGDPLYTWCATAPLPPNIFELLLYGFIRKKPAQLV
jgi:4-hydroxy-3-polyprenylbenzoate decarboxylase